MNIIIIIIIINSFLSHLFTHVSLSPLFPSLAPHQTNDTNSPQMEEHPLCRMTSTVCSPPSESYLSQIGEEHPPKSPPPINSLGPKFLLELWVFFCELGLIVALFVLKCQHSRIQGLFGSSDLPITDRLLFECRDDDLRQLLVVFDQLNPVRGSIADAQHLHDAVEELKDETV